MGKSFKNSKSDELLNELELGNAKVVTTTNKEGEKPQPGQHRNASSSALLNELGIEEKKNSLPDSSAGTSDSSTKLEMPKLPLPESEWQKHLDNLNKPGTTQPAQPTPDNVAFNKTKALDFLKQDYLANRSALDPILTRDMPTLQPLQTVMGNQQLPEQKKNAGPKDKWGTLDFTKMTDPNYHPQGQKVEPYDMRVFSFLTDSKQGANVLKNYYGVRAKQLDEDLNKALADLGKQHPGRIMQSGPYTAPTVLRGPEYEKGAAELRKRYNDQKALLMKAVDLISDEKIYNEAKESADDARKYTGKFIDPKKLGERKREIMGKDYDEAFGITSLDKQKRYELKGLPVDGRTKWVNDQIGLATAANQLEKEIADFRENNPDATELPKAIQNSMNELQQQKAGLINKHSDFVRQQMANEISNQIFKDKNALQTMTGAYTISKKDIQKAAKKLGLDEQLYKDVKPEDIKTANIFGTFINDLAVKPGANIGAMITRPFRKYVLGQDNDWVDARTDFIKEKYTTFFGEAPDAQAQFGTGSKVDINPESQTFLQNIKGDRKFNWNPAAIANTVVSGFAQLSTYGFGAGATGKLLNATNLVKNADKARDAGLVIYGFASQYDDNYQQAKGMGIENEAAANGFAFIRSLASAYTEKIFPDYKVTDALFGPGSTAGKQLISRLAKDGVKGLTEEGLKPILKKGFVSALKDTNKEGLEEVADQLADVITTAVFKPEANKDRDVPRELFETYLTTAIGTIIPVGAGHVRLGKTDSRFTKNMLYHVGLNPDEYKKSIQDEVEDNKLSQAEADKKFAVINTLNKAVQTAPDISPVNSKPLSENDKVDYVHNVMKEGLLKEELNRVKGDDVQEKAINAEISELQKQRQSILERADGIDRNGFDEPMVEGVQEDVTKLEENRKLDLEAVDERIKELDKMKGYSTYETRLAALEKEKQDINDYYDNISSSKPNENVKPSAQQGEVVANRPAEEVSDEQPAQQHEEAGQQPKQRQDQQQPSQQGEEVLNNEEGEEDGPVNPEAALPSRFRKKEVSGVSDWSKDVESTRKALLEPIGKGHSHLKEEVSKVQSLMNTAALGREAYDKAPSFDEHNKRIGKIYSSNLSEAEKQKAYEAERNKLEDQRAKYIADLYHKAKANGNNPNLVNAVEELMNQKATAVTNQSNKNEKPDTANANNSIEYTAPARGEVIDMVQKHGKLPPFMQGMMEKQPEQFVNELKDQVKQGMQPGKENVTGAIEKMYGKPAVDAIRKLVEYENTQSAKEEKPSNQKATGATQAAAKTKSTVPTNKKEAEQFVKDHIIVAKPSHGATQQPSSSKATPAELTKAQEIQKTRQLLTVGNKFKVDGKDVRVEEYNGGVKVVDDEGVVVKGMFLSKAIMDDDSQVSKFSYLVYQNGLDKTEKQASPEIQKIDEELAAAKEELRKALLKARGKLSMNGVIDPDVVAAAVKTLSLFTKRGMIRFKEIMTDLIDTFGKDFFDKENVDAMKGVYSYYRSQQPREDRNLMDSEDDVEDFIELELPNLLNNEEESAFESSAETIANEAETIIAESEAATTNQQRNDAIEKIDTLVNDIDFQLKLAGVYEEGGPDKYETGTGYGKSNREKAFKKDLVKYSKELAKALGYEHDTDKKGRIEYATINIPPAGGDGHIILWKPNSEFGVYINFKVAPDWRNNAENRLVFESSLSDGKQMWRVTTKKNKYTGLANRWDEPMTVGEFAPIIKRAVDYAERALAAQTEQLANLEQEEELPVTDYEEMSDEELFAAEEEMANDPELDIPEEDLMTAEEMAAEQEERQKDADALLEEMAKPSEIFLPPANGKKVVEKAAAFISPEKAAQRLAEWQAEAKRIGKEEDRSNRVIISMFDYTGSWSKPFEDAGYTVLRFDIQHETDEDYEVIETVLEAIERGDKVINIGGNILTDPMNPMLEIMEALKAKGKYVDGILSATPCTTFAGSGATHWPTHDTADFDEVMKRYGWWAAKHFDTPTEYNLFLEATTELWIDNMKPKSFFTMENPVGRIAKMAGLPEPTLQFQPYMFGDPYTKRTQLWGKFNPNLPTAPVEATDGSKIRDKFSSKQKVERSLTPKGFAYAFFMANAANAVSNTEEYEEVDGVPYMYSDAERAEIDKMIEQGKQEGIDTKMLENSRERRMTKLNQSMGKPSIQTVREIFERFRTAKQQKELQANHQPLLPGSYEQWPTTREAFIEELREQGVTYPGRFEKLPEDLKQRVFTAWQQGRAIRNKYGYWPDWMGDIGAMLDTMVLLAEQNARNEKRKAKVPEQEEKLERTIENVDEWYSREIVNNTNFNNDGTISNKKGTGTTSGQLRTDTQTVSTGKPQGVLSEDVPGENAEQVSTRPGGKVSEPGERPDGAQPTEEPGGRTGVEHSYINSGRSGENVEKNEALGGEAGEGRTPKTGEATIVPDRNGRNLVIPPNFEHKKTFSPVQKLNDNIAAIETLYNILKEDRPATDEEKETLFKYVGFGGLKEIAFDPKADRYWQTEQAIKMRPGVSQVYDLAIKLKEVGIDDAIERIKASILNAHYTAIPVIRGIYDAVDKMGFTGGKVLEPSMGIGHFFGAMPSHISKKSELFGVELDSITGNIAKLLYPDARIEVSGLQDARVPKNYLDLIISNIPFGDYKVYDSEFAKSRNVALTKSQLKIHNYFFAKAIDSVRDGGIVAFITSNGVMDSPDNHFMREHITKTTEFLGAIRLPNHAFKSNANTEVVTDIIFLRKFQKGEQTKQKFDILNIVHDTIPHYDGKSLEEGRYNEYFKTHPEMVIGQIKAGNQYSRSGGTTVVSNATDMQTEIANRAAILFPEKVYKKAQHKATDYEAVKQFAIEAAEKRKPGNIIMTKQGMAKMVDAGNAISWKPSGFTQKRVEAFIGVRDALNKVIAAEISGVTDEGLNPLREELNRNYDNYVKQYKQLSSIDNQKLLSHDIDGFNVGALERWDDKNKKWVKADIFTKRTISPYKSITHADNINDALLAVLGETGGVDIERMAELMGKTVDEVAEEGKGLIYEEPSGGFVTADDYLSGPVRKKLAEAKLAAEVNPKFNLNVEALEKVIPEDIKAVDIEARIGARWVGADTYQQFARDIFNTRDYVVTYDPRHDKFYTDWRAETTEMRDTFGTRRIDGGKLFDLALQLKAPVIHDKDLNGNTYVNQEETAAAQEKWDVLRQQFRDWLWKDAERREKLARIYNDTFNDTVKRKYDGSHLTFPGFMYNQKIKELAQHQKDGAWMIIQNNGGIIDHIVGSGKTLIMVIASMEMKRMGIAKKPMIIAMKANVSQIEKQFREVYPTAKVLSVGKESDFAAKNRKNILAQIANNDWDAVIITHDNYKSIPHDPQYSGAVIREELELLEEDMAAIEAEQGKGASKQQLAGMQKRRENLQAKLAKLSDVKKDKEMRTFQELGVDHLMVDESQEFKNLAYSTKLTKVAGLGPTDGSQKAFNLLFGVRYLQDIHRGDKGVTFLSGTPISNTMVEMYLLLKYLRPRMLEEKGMKTFDSWVTAFAQNSRDVEFAVTGALSTKDRFREFLNVPELAMMYNEIADVRNDSNLKLPKPEFKKSVTLSFNEEKTPAQLPEVGAVYQVGDGRLKIYNSKRINETRVDIRGTWIQKPTGASEATTIYKAEGKGPDTISIEGYSTNNYIIKNIEQSPQQQEYTRMLIEFARTRGMAYREALGMPPLNEKNKKSYMINATTASSKMAIDVRLLDPRNGDTPGGKLDVAADTVAEHYFETMEHRGTQLIFSDVGTPKGKETVPNLHQLLMEEYGVNDDELQLIFGQPNEETGKFSVPVKTVKERMEAVLEYTPKRIEELIQEANDSERTFNVYAELKRKMMARGIPEHEIAFIHDYKTKTRKDNLFKAVKEGTIRVLIGSTRMMGTGVNVQDRLRAMHHIDVPWKPSDMEQRNGRGVRQGNKLAEEFYGNEVPVYAYATELTLDAYKYQLLGIKQAYIDQIKSGAVGERTFDEGDADGEGNMGFGEMMAIMSGNPDILEKAKVDKQMKALSTSRRNFEQEKYDAHSKISRISATNENLQKAQSIMANDLEIYRSNQKLNDKGEPAYHVILNGKEFDKAKEAGKYLIELREKAVERIHAVNEINIRTGGTVSMPTNLGTVNGLPIVYHTDGYFVAKDRVTIGSTNINISGALSKDDVAAGTALNSIAKRLENVLQNNSTEIEENKERIKNLQELQNKKWPKEDEYLKLKARQAELDARIKKAANGGHASQGEGEAPVASEQKASNLRLLTAPETKAVQGLLSKAFPAVKSNFYTDQATFDQAAADNRITGSPNAFVDAAGAIHFNPGKIHADTQLHEQGHILTRWAQKYAPSLYDQMLRHGRGATDVMDNLKAAGYQLNNTRMAEEAFVTLLGRIGANEAVEKANAKRPNVLFEFINNAWTRFSRWMAEKYGFDLSRMKSIDKMSMKEFANMLNEKYLLSGVPIFGETMQGEVEQSIDSDSYDLEADQIQTADKIIKRLMKGGNIVEELTKVEDMFAAARATLTAPADIAELDRSQKEFKRYLFDSILDQKVDKILGTVDLELDSQNFAEKTREMIRDRFRRLQQVQNKAVEKGININESNDAFNWADRWRSIAAAKVDDVLKKVGLSQVDVFVWKGREKLKDSLFDRMSKDGMDLNQFGLYLYALHAPERNAHNAKQRRNNFDVHVAELEENLKDVEDKLQADPTNNALKGQRTKLEKELALMNAYLEEYDKGPDVRDQKLISVYEASIDKRLRLMDDGGSGMTNAQAQEIIDEVNSDDKKDKYIEYAKEVKDNIVSEILNQQLEYGMVSQEDYDYLTTYYQNYVPLKVDEEFFGEGKTFAESKIPGAKIFRSKGADYITFLDRVNPFTQSIIDLNATIYNGEQNVYRKKVAKLAKDAADKKVWEVKSARYKPVTNKNGRLLTMQEIDKPTDKEAISYYDNGIKKYVFIHDQPLLKAVAETNTSRAVPYISKFNSFLRAVNTVYNPEFTVSNLIRDLQTAGIVLSAQEKKQVIANFTKNALVLPSIIRGVWRDISGEEIGKWTQLAKEYRDLGGEMTWFKQDGASEQIDDIEKYYKKYQQTGLSEYAKKAAMGMAIFMNKFNTSIENSTRLNIYKSMVDAGVDKNRAVQVARNATINFNRKGTAGPMMDSMYLFYNASIQGTANVFKAMLFTKTGRYIAAGIVAMGYLQSLLNSVLSDCSETGRADDCYDNVKDYEKDKNFVIKNPSGHGFIKIPLAYGYGFFYNLGERIHRAQTGKMSPGMFALQSFSSLVSNFNPVGSSETPLLQQIAPTAADPLVQWSTNKDGLGRPIVSNYQFDRRPDSQKSSPFDSQFSKDFTEWLNKKSGGNEKIKGRVDVSPGTIDWLLETFTGGTGRFIERSATTGPALFNNAVNGQPFDTEIRDVPFLNRFYSKPTRFYDKSKIYDAVDDSYNTILQKDSMKTVFDELDRMVKHGDMEKTKADRYKHTIEFNQFKLNNQDLFDILDRSKEAGVSSSEAKAFEKAMSKRAKDAGISPKTYHTWINEVKRNSKKN